MTDRHLRIMDEVTGREYDPLKPADPTIGYEQPYDSAWLLKTLKTWEDDPTALYMASMSKPQLVNNIMMTAMTHSFKAPLPDAKREMKLFPHQQAMIDKLKAMPEITAFPFDYARGFGTVTVTGRQPGKSRLVESLWRQMMSEHKELSIFDMPVLPTGKNQIIVDSLGHLKGGETFLPSEDQQCHRLQYDCDPLIIPHQRNRITSGIIIYYGAQQ